MRLIDFAASAAQRAGLMKRPGIEQFEIRNGEVRNLAREAGDGLSRIFFDHSGRAIWKWAHYLDAYETHFAKWRGMPVRLLEIGVLHGGSLELWRGYFGERAAIYGIDIDPACAGRVSAPNQVRIGSQGDEAFLRSVVEEMGGVDIVIDDGSHIARDQIASFNTLFPLLSDSGLYVIEDMHTSYWPGHYEGGYGRRGTAIELIKQMLDDLHGWYHSRRRETPARDQVGGIHLYDSLAIIEKQRTRRPSHVHAR